MARSYKQGRKAKKRKQNPNAESTDTAMNKREKNNKNNKRKKNNKTTFNVDRCHSTVCRGGTEEMINSPSLYMKVLVSGVDLCDDHTHGGPVSNVDKNNRNGNNNDNDNNNGNNGDRYSKENENDDTVGVTEPEQGADVVGVTDVTGVTTKSNTAPTDTDIDQNQKTKEKNGNDNDNGNGNGDGDGDGDDMEEEKEEEKKPTKALVHIIRTKSGQFNSSGKKAKTYMVDLPNGDCGDGITNPFPKDEVKDKYWAQRKRFFSKFDDGIQLDKESWYSVTPEAIANHIAKRMAEQISIESSKSTCRGDENDDVGSTGSVGAVILDAFCGCGGNAIGFAKLDPSDVRLIVCVDIDRSKLRMAANNASIYGISEDRIVFIQADSTFVLEQCYRDGTLVDFEKEGMKDSDADTVEMEICKGYKIGGHDLLPPSLDAIFLSPPWGGPDYMNVGKKGYLLNSISVRKWNDNSLSLNGEGLLVAAKNACKMKLVIYFLPRSLNVHSMAQSAWKAGYKQIEVEKNVLNGKLKTITVYLTNE